MSSITCSPRPFPRDKINNGGGISTQPSLVYQRPNSPLYPVSHREVVREFHVTRKYKYLAGGNSSKDFEYYLIKCHLSLPGFVELPSEKCDLKKTVNVVCADCGVEDVFVSGGCDNPRCFVCHVKWSKKKAYDAGLRVMACLEKTAVGGGDCGVIGVRGDNNKDKIDLWHFTLSPPENRFASVRNEGYLDDILKECYKMCKNNGIAGGCVVLHYGPERGDKGINKYLPEGTYRPHLHVLGHGKRPRGPWENDRGEWICRTLNDGKPVERSFDFIKKGLHYRLSHALRRRGKHSLRWFGAWAYNVGIGNKDKLVKLGLKRNWIERVTRCGCEVVCKCPKCGGMMIRKTVYDSNGGVFVDIKGPPL